MKISVKDFSIGRENPQDKIFDLKKGVLYYDRYNPTHSKNYLVF